MKYIDELNMDGQALAGQAKKELNGKRVLVRVDFNVAVVNGKIHEDFRIKAHIPTIDYLLDNGAKVALLAHISDVDTFKNLTQDIGVKLGHDIMFVDDCIGHKVQGSLFDHNLVMLENVRKYKEELDNDDQFAKKLVEGFDLFVGDAFATAHRKHASIVGVTKHIVSYAGLLIKKEIKELREAIDAPQAGKTLILGGAKISTKLPVIKNFTTKAEDILIGGAIVNNFLKYYGREVGISKIDKNELYLIKEIEGAVLNTPLDFICSKTPDGKSPVNIRFQTDLRPDEMILDIGPETANHYSEIITRSKIVIWNGPMGLIEVDEFAKGTKKIAEAVAKCEVSYVGGGDTIAEIDELGMRDKVNHISTGGGAMLEFLGENRMPGLEALGYYKDKF